MSSYRYILIILVLFGRVLIGQNFWAQKPGPAGATIAALYCDTSGYILAGTNAGLVYRSTNNGDSWVFGFYNKVPVTKFIKLTNGNVMMASTGRGVWTSSDEGVTWYREVSSITSFNISTLALTPDGTVLAGTAFKGIYRSTNNGFTWSNAINQSLSVVAFHVLGDGSILAGTYYNGMYRSTDNGAGWAQFNGGQSFNIVYAFAQAPNGNLLVSTNTGVFRSSNSGQSWTLLHNPEDMLFSASVILSNSTLLVNQAGRGIYRSTDNGTTFTKTSSGLIDSSSNCISVQNSSGKVFVGSTFGVSLSTNNGDIWKPKIEGLNGLAIYAFAITPDGNTMFATASGRTYRSTDGGAAWTRLTTANGGDLAAGSTTQLLAVNNSTLLIPGFGGMYRSTNLGSNWTAVAVNESNGLGSFLQLDASTVLVGSNTTGRVYKSTNGGASFTQLSTGLSSDKIVYLFKGPSNIIFGGNLSKFYKSTNGGTSWTALASVFPSGVMPVEMVTLPDGSVFAATTTGLYKSANNGDTWTLAANQFSSKAVNSLIYTAGNALIAGTEDGAYLSGDKGVSWTQINSGFFGTQVTALTKNNAGIVFAGTNGSGIYASTTAPSGVNSADILPDGFSIEPVFPNPFNPSTTIRYTLNKASKVSIEVINTQGAVVSRLANEEQQTGQHEIRFTADGLTSGVYFIRLNVGGVSAYQKALLLK